MLTFDNDNFNSTKKDKLLQEDTFEKCINFIEDKFRNYNEEHIILGNKFFISFLKEQRKINLDKHEGHYNRLDRYAVIESLWLLFRVLENEFFNDKLIIEDKLGVKIKDEDMKLLDKHINRLYNTTHQLVNNDSSFENLQTFSMRIKKDINKYKRQFENDEEFLEYGKDLLHDCLEEYYKEIDEESFEKESNQLLNKFLEYKVIN